MNSKVIVNKVSIYYHFFSHVHKYIINFQVLLSINLFFLILFFSIMWQQILFPSWNLHKEWNFQSIQLRVSEFVLIYLSGVFDFHIICHSFLVPKPKQPIIFLKLLWRHEFYQNKLDPSFLLKVVDRLSDWFTFCKIAFCKIPL